MQELRRGSDRADIWSLAFDHTSSWLATTSDKGTCHIFVVSKNNEPINMTNEEEEEGKNP